MSEHRGGLVFHLISAHELAWTACVPSRYYALCGAPVSTGDSLGDVSACPNACDCELSGSLAYCLDCLRAALEQGHRAGVEAAVDGSVVAAGG